MKSTQKPDEPNWLIRFADTLGSTAGNDRGAIGLALFAEPRRLSGFSGLKTRFRRKSKGNPSQFAGRTGLLGPVYQVVRVYRNAVTADQSGGIAVEIPLGGGGIEHLSRVQVKPVEDERKLVHKGDVQVSLDIFDHFRSFSRPDVPGFKNVAGCPRIEAGDTLQGLFIHSGDYLCDFVDCMLFVSGIDPLRGIADFEIWTTLKAGLFLSNSMIFSSLSQCSTCSPSTIILTLFHSPGGFMAMFSGGGIIS